MKKEKKQFMTRVSSLGSNQRMCQGILCDSRDHYKSAHTREFAEGMSKANKIKKQIIGKGLKMSTNKTRVF